MGMIPDDFDWVAYRSLNPDLRYITTESEAKKHYKLHGHHQQRKYAFEVPTSEHPEKVFSTDPLTTHYNNKLNGVPVDFDWIAYRSLNPDLSWLNSYVDAIKHYRDHGCRQNHQYKYEKPLLTDTSRSAKTATTASVATTAYQYQGLYDTYYEEQNKNLGLPEDFDWNVYRTNNTDLNWIKTYPEAVKHYLEHGHNERRVYKKVITTKPIEVMGGGQLRVPLTLPQPHPQLQPQLPQQPPQQPPQQLPQPEKPMIFDNIRSRPLERVVIDRDWIEFRPVPPSHLETPESDVNLPLNFDWKAYKMLNRDLNYLKCEADAVRHYKTYGVHESRVYRFETQQRPQPQPRPKLKPKPTPNPIPVIKPRLQPQPQPQTPITKKPQTTKIQTPKKLLTSCLPKIVSEHRTMDGQIPNIVHYVYGFEVQKTEFELYKALSILSAFYVLRPDKICFHYKHEPYGPHWDRVKPLVELVLTEPPEKIYDKTLRHFAHKADVVRLQILNEVGGIYLDIDTLCLKPLSSLLEQDFVMGVQGENYGLCNAIMLSKPNTIFGQKWIESYKSFVGAWDTHSVKIPYALHNTYPITLVSKDTFFYPLWEEFSSLVLSSPLNYDSCHHIIQHSFCLHLWERWTGRALKEITLDNLKSHKSLYNLLARKFIWSRVMIMMNLKDLPKTTTCEALVAVIGSYYKVLCLDEVECMCIDYQDFEDTYANDYLQKLSRINPKFRPKCDTVKVGVILRVDSLYKLPDQSVITQVVDLLYNESNGVVGLYGPSHGLPHEGPRVTFTSTVEGIYAYRQELDDYGIKTNPFDCEGLLKLGKRVVSLRFD
jgi:hypothetical protein